MDLCSPKGFVVQELVRAISIISYLKSDINKSNIPTYLDLCSKKIEPNLAAFAAKYSAAKFVKVSTTEAEELATENGVTALPTIQIYVKGRCHDRNRPVLCERSLFLTLAWHIPLLEKCVQ